MRASLALSALITAALVACVSDSPSHPAKTFTTEQKALCPENPFKSEYGFAPKRAASAPIRYHIEIYASAGSFVNEYDGITGASQTVPPNNPGEEFIWDKKDANGSEVPSGYYFLLTSASIPNSDITAKRTNCIFVVNEQDTAKLK